MELHFMPCHVIKEKAEEAELEAIFLKFTAQRNCRIRLIVI